MGLEPTETCFADMRLCHFGFPSIFTYTTNWRKVWDSNPWPVSGDTELATQRIKPLCQPSQTLYLRRSHAALSRRRISTRADSSTGGHSTRDACTSKTVSNHPVKRIVSCAACSFQSVKNGAMNSAINPIATATMMQPIVKLGAIISMLNTITPISAAHPIILEGVRPAH
jgi:hypothetical protein